MERSSIRFRRERLTIASLGKGRFWIGLLAGVFTSVMLSWLMNHYREWMRFVNTIDADLVIPDAHIYLWHNLFVSSLSVVLGLSIALWIWMDNRNHAFKHDRLRKTTAQTYALFTFWMFVMVITRAGTILPIILGSFTEIFNELYRDRGYFLVLILIPPVVFLQNWLAVLQVYRSAKWMLWSLVASAVLVAILMLTTTVDPRHINQFYQTQYSEEFSYIDGEVERAYQLYGIVYSQEAIDVLKQWHSEASMEQVDRIREAFQSSRTVPLDTIILQKMVIRNLKSGNWNGDYRFSQPFCFYASPAQIAAQLRKHDSGDPEYVELMAVFQTYREIIEQSGNDGQSLTGPGKLRARRAMNARWGIGNIINLQINEILEKLPDKQVDSD